MEHRFATEADLDRLAAWNRELIEDERADNPMDEPALRERMRGWLAGEYRAVLFEEGGEPVAYALYRPDEHGVHLRQLFVVRARRGRGVGRRAVTLLCDRVLPRDLRISVEVLVHNGGGLAFWRAVGFCEHALTFTARTEAPL